jgi:hypothetical protein
VGFRTFCKWIWHIESSESKSELDLKSICALRYVCDAYPNSREVYEEYGKSMRIFRMQTSFVICNRKDYTRKNVPKKEESVIKEDGIVMTYGPGIG